MYHFMPLSNAISLSNDSFPHSVQADRRVKDAQMRAAINQQLVESGEKER
jgi:hypothetical protein